MILLAPLSSSTPILCCPLYRYIVHQWQVARGAIFLYPNSVAFDLPKELFSIVRYENFCQILAVVPFFQDIPKALMARICCNANIINIPAGQFMTYAREVSNQMYIIDKGYCDVISADGAMKRIIGPGDSIAVLETVLNRPVINTVSFIVSSTSLVTQNHFYCRF